MQKPLPLRVQALLSLLACLLAGGLGWQFQRQLQPVEPTVLPAPPPPLRALSPEALRQGEG